MDSTIRGQIEELRRMIDLLIAKGKDYKKHESFSNNELNRRLTIIQEHNKNYLLLKQDYESKIIKKAVIFYFIKSAK